jgi:CheY-like chemotaxis protein
MDYSILLWAGFVALVVAGGAWWRARARAARADAAEREAAALAALEAMTTASREAQRRAAEAEAAEAAEAAARARRVEQEAAARAEAERAEAERLKAERAAAARIEAARAEAARAEAERAAQAERQAEAERRAAARQQAEAQAQAQAQAQARQHAAEVEAARRTAESEQAAARALAPPPVPQSVPQPVPPRPLRPEEVLVMVADDSKVVRVKTSRLLAQHGYRVVLAEDGAQALQLIDAEVPRVLITDVEMPGLDGFALTRHVRQHPRAAHIPVIMITAASERLQAAADAAGVTLVLGKPYAEETLLACIEQARTGVGDRAGDRVATT